MLPDFIKEKLLFKKELDKHFKKVLEVHTNPFSQVPKFIQHEGNRCTFENVEGNIKEFQYQEIVTKLEVTPEEAPNLSTEKIFEKVTNCAIDMARQQSKLFFQVIESATKKVGNIVDAKGKPFTIDLFLDLLEKIEIAFDENEQPILPSIVAGAKVHEQIVKAFPDLEKNDEYRKRLKEIIILKKVEWRDRESRRRLVG